VPALAATSDGAELLITTSQYDYADPIVHLVTIDGAANRVEDIGAIPAVPPPDPGTPGAQAITILAASGGDSPWLFARSQSSITAVRKTTEGWKSSNVVPEHDPSIDTYPTGAAMSDDGLGYLAYMSVPSDEPHLSTWDGSCWKDEIIGGEALDPLVLETDAAREPWAAWLTISHSLYLRSPDGTEQDLMAPAVPAPGANVGAPVRVVPGGLDGTDKLPLVAAHFNEGIGVFTSSPTASSGWRSFLLPESNSFPVRVGGCSVANRQSADFEDPCRGLTTCTEQFNGASTGFDVARTQSGKTYAVWVTYAAVNSLELFASCNHGGELPTCTCVPEIASGTGKATLIVARLGESEPILSHFDFDIGGCEDTTVDVVAAARGDTLLVGTYLGGAATLTYLELDSSLLP
jgi:hypothetical protein